MSKEDAKRIIKKKEGKDMAVSMAVIPTLRGKAANSVIETLSASKIKPYSLKEKYDAEQAISEILQKRDDGRNVK